MCFLSTTGRDKGTQDRTPCVRGYSRQYLMTTASRKYLVDGHWGPPWPRGLFGVQEPVDTSIGRAAPSSRDGAVVEKENPSDAPSERSKSIVRDSSTKLYLGTKVDGYCESGRELKRPQEAAADDAAGGHSDIHIELQKQDQKNDDFVQPHYSNPGKGMKPPNKASRLGGVMRKKPLDIIQSSKIGHRMLDGKITSMPLVMSNKAYKKPQQLSLKQYMK